MGSTDDVPSNRSFRRTGQYLCQRRTIVIIHDGLGRWRLVTWSSSSDQDGDGYGVYQQRYNSAGGTVGGEVRVNSQTSSDQHESSVTAPADGGWLVIWTSLGQDGDSYGAYQRHFATDLLGDALADQLAGSRWDETLIGFSGNDRLDGKGGNDVLIGSYGNDVYVVNSAGDQGQEMVNQGKDTILSSVTFGLAPLASVENLTLTGTKGVTATRNEIANIVTGSGGKGDDPLKAMRFSIGSSSRPAAARTRSQISMPRPSITTVWIFPD
jgi:Ca2+-binding RTX toxin-like protein